MASTISHEPINYARKAINFYLGVNYLQYGQHLITSIEWEIWHQLWKSTSFVKNNLMCFQKAHKI